MNWHSLLLSCLISALLVSCQKATPRDTFTTAVLNCNLLHGFAGRGMRSELEQPSVKLVEGSTDKTVPMKRVEVVDGKIQSAQDALAKVRKLGADADSKPMIDASIALYKFVLPVYQNEYRKLAGLYDSGADPKEISALEQSIEKQYQPKFAALHDAVTTAGKAFAAKHQIPVQWDVKTSPGG